MSVSSNLTGTASIKKTDIFICFYFSLIISLISRGNKLYSLNSSLVINL